MLDHIVYAVPDLDHAVAELERATGVRAAAGGSHPGFGTRNALLGLGERRYLEVIGPDPAQQPSGGPLPFGIEAISSPRIATWAAWAGDLESRVEEARQRGYDPGAVLELEREAPDGTRYHWRLTFSVETEGDGLVPFLIDWGASAHPTDSAPTGCRLAHFHGEHPRPEPIRNQLAALGVELEVRSGQSPALIAELNTPNGRVSLR